MEENMEEGQTQKGTYCSKGLFAQRRHYFAVSLFALDLALGRKL